MRNYLIACFFMVAGTANAQDASVASFAPGSHGEPFAVQGVMQGCAEPELDGCMFYAEGVRWAVTRGAGGNEAAITAMAALPVNAPVFVSGDMVSMGDITVDAMISKLEPGTPDAYAALRDAMQGDWVSAEDPQSMLSVVGSEETEIYGGETLITSVVSFADACPGGEPIGTVMYKQEMGGDPMDLPCFAVLDITPDRMELSYVGRGNTLLYLRP
jgi:hypothetical protein